jgi:hypothetical protein
MFDCSPPPRKPIEYTPEAVDYVCERIYTSEKGVKSLHAEDVNFPSPQTIAKWCREHPEFVDKYMEARKLQILFATDDMLEISALASNENWCQVQAILSTKKWLAKVLLPHIFGDRVDVKHTHVKAEEWLELMKEPEEILIEHE